MGGLMAVLVIAAGVVALVLYQRKVETEKELDRAHDEDFARRRAQAQALALARDRVGFAIDDSRRKAAALPSIVSRADESIHGARVDFDEHAYGPFWSAIEATAVALADYSVAVQSISANAATYADFSRQLRPPIPPFELGMDALPSVADSMQGMESLVREAQRDFHFAAIYEQRKTNQILVAGFLNLEQAIWQLGDRLDSSLGSLSDALTSTMSSEFAAQTEALTSAIAAQTQAQTQSLASNSRALREEMRESRRIAENESRARVRRDRNEGDIFAR